MMDARTATAPSLTLVRRIKATPGQVFAAWTDPAVMALWLCPANCEVAAVEADARLGGRYRIVMREKSDGEIHDVSGRYEEFVADERLVFTWSWITMPERQSLVTVGIRPIEGGTELTLTHSRFADEAARDNHEEGWSSTLGKLEALFDEAGAAAEGER
jgi:uncharacterized protein YndB with AHSA1/START domain